LPACTEQRTSGNFRAIRGAALLDALRS